MAVIETWLHQDADSLVEVVPLKGNLFYGDNEGNLIGVEVTRAGAAVSLPSGCYGFVLRSDGSTEYVPGTVSGNKAWIILPTGCYAQIGPIGIVIKTGATKQGNKAVGGVTLAACTGYVYKTHTDTIVDPGSVLPNIGQLQQAMANCIAATNETENIDISQTKSGNTITVRTTNRNGVSTENTLTEPTVTVTKHGTTDPVPAREGDFDITVKSSNGTQVVTNTVTIPNPNAELADRAHVETVSRSKTRTGNPIVIEDAVAEIADKTVIKLEPRQDLHGYDKPWVGGAGKNLLKYPYTNTTVTRNGITFTDNGDGTITLNGTSTETTTDFTVVSISNGLPLANGDYILTGILESGTVDSTSTSAIYLHAKGDVSESGYTNFQPDVGAGRERTITIINGSMYNFTLRVGMSGVTFTDYKIKLMLRSASNTDTSYEPYQNICPITGYDTVTVTNNGSDIFDGALEQGSIDVSTGKKSTISQAKRIRTANQILLKKGTYTISGDGVQKCYSYRYNLDGSYWGRIGTLADLPFTFTVDADCKAMFTLYKADNSNFTVADISSVTIVETASYPIAVSLAEDSNHNPAGTVYGGTVTINADGSGTVVVDRKSYDMGAAVNYKHATYTSCFGLNVNLYTEWTSGIVETISSMFPVDLSINFSYNSSDSYPDNTMFRNSGNKIVYLKCSAYANMTLEEVQTALTGQTIVVPITPVTYELTANQVQTLIGYNYIYTDGAEISLTYRQQTFTSNDTLLRLLPTGTATGNPAVISDGAEGVPLKNLTVNIEPKQEGTGDPSPSNVLPISGWTAVNVMRKGKNLWGLGNQSVSKMQIVDFEKPLSPGTYTISLMTTSNDSDATTCRFNLLDSTHTAFGDTIQFGRSERVSQTVTINQDWYGVYLYASNNAANSTGDTATFTDIQIEEGSTATAYEPYKGKVYPISLPTEAGTVYGGTLTLDQNGEGTLTIDSGIHTVIGNEDNSGINKTDADKLLVYFTLSNVALGLYETILAVDKGVIYDGSSVRQQGVAVSGRSGVSGLAFRIPWNLLNVTSSDPNDTIRTAAMAWLADNQFTVVYRLLTPTTYTLTAEQVKTLLGTNYISCDAGSMDIEYFKKLLDGTGNSGTGEYSHVEGRATIASGLASHAEGDDTEATGVSAHSEGYSTHATGDNSHAEGMNSTASGEEAHAEGFLATASGAFSHAEGSTTTASGQSAHAEGKGTIANHLAQHVFGIFNAADPMESGASDKGLYAEIVGNGENASNRSNARTLDWNGNEILSGKLTVGASPTNSMDVATKEYVDDNGTLVVTIPVSSGSNIISAFGGTKYGEYKAIAFHGANPGIFSSMTVQTLTSFSTAMDDYKNGISVSCTFASASTAIAVVTIVLQKVAKVRTYTRNGSTYSYTDTTPLTHTTVFDV